MNDTHSMSSTERGSTGSGLAAPAFSPRAAISYGWSMTKEHLGLLVKLALLSALVGIVQDRLQRIGGVAPWLLGLMVQVFGVVLSMAWVRISLGLHDGRPVRLSDAMRVTLPGFFSYALAMAAYGLIVAVGLVLLIVPGVLWALKFCLAGFLVVDKDLNPLAALRRSAALTECQRKELLVLGLMLLGVNLLGALALGVGLLVTVPTSALAATYAYRRLLGAVPAADAVTPEAGAHQDLVSGHPVPAAT